MRDTTHRFAIRTIKDGQITFDGRQWVPDARHMAYDGRLDGLRFAFGRYRYLRDDAGREELLCLWGTEEQYWACGRDDDEYNRLYSEAPECVEGTYPWEWWMPVAGQS